MDDSRKCLKNYDGLLSGEMLFEESITPIMIVDSERTIVKANNRFFCLFGYSPEEILGLKTSILTPTVEHFEEYKKFFEQTRDGSYESSELRYKKKDGSLFWVKLKGITIQTESEEFILWSFDDITKEIQARDEIKRRSLELQIIFDRVKTGLVFVSDGVIERANPSFLQMLNEEAKNVVGRDIKLFFNCFENCSRKTDKKIIKMHGANGVNVFVEREILPVSDNSFVVVLIDVTDHMYEKQSLAKMAQTDGLTEIYNRTTFMHLAQEMMLDPNVDSMTFVMFDIDHFKAINDTWGHDIGDEVLRELSSMIKNSLRKDEIFGRLGGEEFGIIFTMAKEDVTGICGRLMDTIRDTAFTRKDIKVTISMGVADNTFSGLFDSLYREADRLLYKAKQAGRNTLMIS